MMFFPMRTVLPTDEQSQLVLYCFPFSTHICMYAFSLQCAYV